LPLLRIPGKRSALQKPTVTGFNGFQGYKNANESSDIDRTPYRTPGQQEAPQSEDIRGLVTFVGGLDDTA